MAVINWIDNAEDWTTATDWSSGTVPGAAADVIVGQGAPQVTTNVGTVKSLSNQAELAITSGGAGLTVNGPLSNSGYIEFLGNANPGAPTTLAVQGLSNEGTISLSNLSSDGNYSSQYLAMLKVNSQAGFGMPGVLTGSINLAGTAFFDNHAIIEFAGGQIATVAGELTISGTNAFVADAGATTSNSALTGLSVNNGTIYLEEGASITTTGDLANNGTFNLDTNTDGFGSDPFTQTIFGPLNLGGGSSLTVGGTLTNSGALNLGITEGSTDLPWQGYPGLHAPKEVSVNGLSNTGGIVNVGSVLKVNAPAGFGTIGVLTGAIQLGALNEYTFNGGYPVGMVEFASGQITTIASNASLTLNGNEAFIADAGATASNSALTGLSHNAGALSLNDGASITTIGAFSNSGSISLDAVAIRFYPDPEGGPVKGSFFSTGGSSLTIGGLLSNSGDIQIGHLGSPKYGSGGLSELVIVTADALSNSGMISIEGNSADAMLNIKGDVTGTGSITIGPHGVLEIGGAVNETITFADTPPDFLSSGPVTLKLDDPGKFNGVLAGLATGDVVDLAHTVVTSATVKGNVLTIIDDKSKSLHYQLAGDAAFAIEADGAGGSDLIVTPLRVTGLSESPPSGPLGVGKSVALTLTTNEPVTVTGSPTLTLNDAGVATYDAAKSTALALVFNYMVIAGQNTSALQAIAVNLPGDATIKDQFGNKASLSLGNLMQKGPQIDTNAPFVGFFAASPSPSIINAGKTITISLGVNEPVIVTGTPTLALSDGGVATFDATKSTARSLAFNYTVAAGDNARDLMITGVQLGSGDSVTDLAGNATNFAHARGFLNIAVDTTAPKLSQIFETSAGGPLTTGDHAQIHIVLNERVAVTGTPILNLNDGGVATFDAAKSTDRALVFEYTVGAAETTPDLAVAGVTLSAGASVKDLAGNAASFAGANTILNVAVNSAKTIVGNGDLEIIGPSAENITFAKDAAATLTLDQSTKFAGRISGLTPKDVLDLTDISFGPQTTVGFSGSSWGGSLTVSDGAHAAKIALLGNYIASTFAASSDGHGGTNIVDTPAHAQAQLLSTPHHA